MVTRIVSVLVVATLLGLAALAGPALAGVVDTNGTVTSGNASYRIFSTQRVATRAVNVRQNDVDPEAAMRYRVYNCADSSQHPGSRTVTLNDAEDENMGINAGCFRIGSRRNEPMEHQRPRHRQRQHDLLHLGHVLMM